VQGLRCIALAARPPAGEVQSHSVKHPQATAQAERLRCLYAGERIMSGAGRGGDSIAHSSALGGLLTGLAIGVAIALTGVAIVGSGGLAAVAVVGGIASAGAGIGEVMGSLSFCTNDSGQIITGSPNVFINGRPAALAQQSTVACDKHGIQRMAEGSSKVFINGHPVARIGDRSTCGGKISSGSSNVFIGGGTLSTEDIDPEVPLWLEFAIAGLGLGSGLALKVGLKLIAKAAAGGFLGGTAGHFGGGKFFGEGSDGQKLLAASLLPRVARF